MTVNVAGFTTADILTASSSAGAGGTVFFPNGVYTVDGLQNLQPFQTWILDRYALLQKPATSSTAQIIENKADGFRLRGGCLRDTLSNTTLHGIYSGDNLSIELEDVTLIDVRGWGISTNNALTKLRRVSVFDSLNGGVLIAQTLNQRGPLIDEVYVRRTYGLHRRTDGR